MLAYVFAAPVALLGLGLVAMWLSPLEAQTLNVGHLIGRGAPDPRVSTLAAGIAAWALAVLIIMAARIPRRND